MKDSPPLSIATEPEESPTDDQWTEAELVAYVELEADGHERFFELIRSLSQRFQALFKPD